MGFNIPFKWTRLIYVLSVGVDVFSPTGHTEYNNATLRSTPPPKPALNGVMGRKKVDIYPCGNEASDVVN